MNPVTLNPDLLTPDWRRVGRLADLAEIFEPEVQICTCPREIDPRITAYLNQLNPSATFQSIEAGTPDEQLQMSSLPAGPGRETLIEDLELLKAIVHDLLGCPLTGVRVARIGHTMCPGWHFDKTGLRLVCTYQGPGTEWLDDQAADRGRLDKDEYRDKAFYQAGEGEIVILKGSLWQGNESFGSIHRSPDVDPGRGLRLVVTIDALWED